MKNEQKTLTPADAGLSLVISSGPRGSVQQDGEWPCIEYTVELMDKRRRPIWSGPYRLGVGHVKLKTPIRSAALPLEQLRLWEAWQSKPYAQFTDKQLWADTAATVAKLQKVSPKLEDVCHSLLSDGAAFFDGMRFEDWAMEMGGNPDSIKEKETFDACDKIGRDLSRHLSRDQLNALRNWASNY